MQFDELPSQFFAHFGNAARFTYFIVGDMPEAQAKNIATRYLACLKATPIRRFQFPQR
nr:insulinase family protein [Hoylesella shahii]